MALYSLGLCHWRGEGTAVDVAGVAGRTQNLRGGIPPELEVQIADLQIPQFLIMQSIHLRVPLMKNWTELN